MTSKASPQTGKHVNGLSLAGLYYSCPVSDRAVALTENKLTHSSRSGAVKAPRAAFRAVAGGVVALVLAAVAADPQSSRDARGFAVPLHAGGQGQRATGPRLREGSVSAQIPEAVEAVGGGEVVLELAVDARGTVGRVEPIRTTPPYTDLVVNAAATWQFEPATSLIDGRATTAAAPVLVVAIFRPPQLYGGPARGVVPQTVGVASPRLPRLVSLVMPAYPPTATGNGIVLVEIELSGRAASRGYRIVGPTSGFDSAALDAVRAWRFDAPGTPEAVDRIFVYAVLGFRTPLAPIASKRE